MTLLVLLMAVLTGDSAGGAGLSLPGPSDYAVISKKADMPAALHDGVLAYLAAREERAPSEIRRPRDLQMLLADAGEAFNATDVVDLRKPDRRLVMAGDGPAPFVAYEHGGIGSHCHLLLFLRRGDQLALDRNIVYLCRSGDQKPNDVAALWQEVRAGHPELAYSFDV